MAVRLNNPIWNKAKRANAFGKVIYAVGQEAKKDVDLNFRTAKRSGVVAKVQKVKFSGRGKDRKRTVTGSKTVRRSAYGETPQVVTGELKRGTKVKRNSAFSVTVYNDVQHAKHLEPPAKLNRPFLEKPIAANRKKYIEMIDKAVRTLT